MNVYEIFKGCDFDRIDLMDDLNHGIRGIYDKNYPSNDTATTN